MHELSIAMSMIDIASEEVAGRGGGRVTALHLKLGPLSGVVKDALLFSYDVAASGTALEGSSLVIEEVPLIVFCRSCNQQQTIETIQHLGCPVCGELTPEVVSGRELQIVAMEIEEAASEGSNNTLQAKSVGGEPLASSFQHPARFV
jgi:hydrogenase nickel incorporation protein HypA/HybF